MKGLLFILTLFILPVSYGQLKDKFGQLGASIDAYQDKEMRGDKMYNIYGYSQAIKFYTADDSLTASGLRRLADSYSKMNEYQYSLDAYRQLVQRPDCTAADFYDYANMLKVNKQYQEADAWLEKYHEKSPEEIRAKNNIANLNEASALQVDRGIFSISNLPINTDKQEFGPSLYAGQLIFSSNGPRKGIIIRKYIGSNQPFLDFYAIDTTTLFDSVPKAFEPKFNKKFHEGTMSFTGDMKRVYFTANNYKAKSEDGTFKLQIYYSDIDENGVWADPILFELNNPEYSTGHPWVSSDGKTLYFSSDKPGGMGGVDIYTSTMKKDGTWNEPINVGAKINTEGNEMYPFFNEEKQILYFSSDGHYGLGGLDIFASAIHFGEFGKVNNFGAPLNSSNDDFGIIFNAEMKGGFFASNRTSGVGGDDIYSIKSLKDIELEENSKEIKGIAVNQEGKLLENARILLYDKNKVIVDSVLTDATGSYSFTVVPYKEYTIVGSKKIHKTDSTLISTDVKDATVTANLTLIREKIIPEFITIDHQLYLSVQTIYFDLNSAELREDKRNLDHVVQVMNDYPSMEIELGSHTDCRGTRAYNQNLANERAKSSAEYIKQRITNPERIYGKGYGETMLTNGCACEGRKVSTCSDEEHQANRRTEFKIVKQ